jgi:hypothetical protein
MARHMRLAVDDFIYWGVVAIASAESRTHGEVLTDLIAEALRWRALAAERVPRPATEFEDAIAQAAGLEGIAVDDMRMRLLSLGWWTHLDDLAEHALSEDGE